MTEAARLEALRLLRDAGVRYALRLSVSAAMLEITETRKWCSGCNRWLPHDEFGHGLTLCRTCEAVRVRQYRERQRAA